MVSNYQLSPFGPPHNDCIRVEVVYLCSSRKLPHKQRRMGKIPGSAHLNLGLGGLVIAGGTYGYFKKGSTPSLIAGLSVGSLLMGSGYLIAATDRVYEGHCLATASSGLLALAMGSRFVSTGKFMPAGMVATLGALGCAYNLNKALEWAPTKGGT